MPPHAPTGDDVVFTFSQLTWHAARARGMYFPEDRLAQALLHHPRVDRVLVANQVRSRPVVRVRGMLGREDAGFPGDADHVLAQPLRLARSEPAAERGARRVFAAYDRALRRGAERMGLRRPAVITAHPLVAAFCDLRWAGPVTYYAVDDWAAHPGYARQRALHTAAYARMRERQLRVCAVSTPLLDVLEPAGPRCVVPNGVEPLEWQGNPSQAPRRVGGPRLVYVGTLDSRLDVQALLRLAADMPEASIVLTGPIAEPEHLRPLDGAGNIELRGPVGRDGVIALLRAADACLLPHVRSALTEAMSPLKVYEYLAAGRPVVAADLPPVRDIDPRVLLIEPGGDFVAGVRRALALGPVPERERLAFVKANSWAERHERILDLALPV
ncbi:MAG: glycosyltransferase [Solirubrobacterales bacterium]|nr:glycosyltransferase [Solirubrobacterales bacterium]